MPKKEYNRRRLVNINLRSCFLFPNRIPGYERFGHSWAIPEDAFKPERLAPGVKAKHPSACDKAE